MKCLWLTRKYPRPVNSGELIYSDGLIRSFAATGVSLTVIAHDNDERPVGNSTNLSEQVDSDGVIWRLGSPQLGGRLGSLLTKYPSDSWRLKHGGPEEILKMALQNELWDVVVIDHAAMGWGLSVIEAYRSRSRDSNLMLVYVSHNHEARVRKEVAKKSQAKFPRNLVLQWDAEKYARQENALCASADLVTAITETEVEAFRAELGNQNYLCLTPGYDGKVVSDRQITEETPRRVVMSGSFEWVAKRINLERFLEKAAVPLLEAGIELQIVGKADDVFR
ncbi:MAG: hypothetical protein AAGA96_18990, partial [Verrucomicrobiota bacterium]